MSLIFEFPGGFQLFSDGSYKHLDHEVITASSSSTETSCDGYKFKDVIIDSLKPITARMFLPDVPESVVHQQLPLLVHFHGGAFCFGTTTWTVYHTFLGNLSVLSKAIIFSVDYRLAPDHKLPVAFDDCYASLEWLITSKNRGGGDSSDQQWLQRADLSRVFLLGDSAGANIVHQVATRAIQDEAFNVQIKGLLSIHPLFGSENKNESEMADDGPASFSAAIDMLWKLSLPDGENHDYYGCNFESKQLSANEWNQFPEILVFVAGMNVYKERGVKYAEFLQENGVPKVKLIEAKDEEHVFFLFNPESEATRLIQKQITDFIGGL